MIQKQLIDIQRARIGQSRRWLAVFGAATMAVLIGACLSAAEPVGPRVKTHHESFDFGIVPQDAEVSHVFWLRNTGDEELVISDIVPNCGCTEVPLEKDHVSPGDSTRVQLIFGSGRFHGAVRKFAQIKSNSTGRAPALIFSADVAADSDATGPIVLKPSAVGLDDVRPEESPDGFQFTVTVENTGREAVDISIIDRPDRAIRIEPFENGALQPGESRQLTLVFDSDLPSQLFSHSITFDVSDTTQRRITLPIYKKSAWNDDATEGS